MPQDLANAIATNSTESDRQPHSPKTDALTRKCRYIIAAVLTWDTQREVSSDEIITVMIAKDILWVKLTNNRAVPIHVDVFRGIRRQQLEQQARVEAEMDLENVVRQSQVEHCAYNSLGCSPNSLDNNTNAQDIEVDSDDSVNPTYRVWISFNLLGTFHQSPVDGRWLTFPTYGRDFQRHATSDEAVAAIATAWNNAQFLRNSDKAVAP